jgi:uncharacterized membrane protein YfcA
MAVGVAAGSLGAMLGIGGAVLIVPLFNVGFGYPIFTAASAGLVTVIGTSTSVSSAEATRALLNIRLAVMLLVASVIGALSGVHAIKYFVTERAAELVYGLTSVVVAIVMLRRIDVRNISRIPGAEIGPLGGRYFEHESGCEVSYAVRRAPLALTAALLAGVVSSIAGVGGGMVLVPALNAWCGVPMRVAAVTSAFMIGITAVPGLIGHYQLGHFNTPELAAAAVIGVLVGARCGLWLSTHAPVKAMKLLMALLLVLVGGYYVVHPWR